MGATGLIAGVYEVGPAIGSGAASIVHLGWKMHSRDRVAVKTLRTELFATSPDSLAGLCREAQALRRLHHPNIIRLLRSALEAPEPSLVLEYAGGGSLAELLQRQPQLPIDRALDVGLGVAAALVEVHAMGILHRDVKPSNILFADDGTPRLTDFGLARLPNAAPARGPTAGSAVDGTFAYLSPEAWQSGKLDARTDLWSLGIVLFEMLAGRRPFEGDSPWQIRWAVLNDPLPDVRDFRTDLPAGLADLVQRMLMRDQAMRVTTAAEVRDELARIKKARDRPELFVPGAARLE